jgi:hypothetical protein
MKLNATSQLFGACLEDAGVIYIGTSGNLRLPTTEETAAIETKAAELAADYASKQYQRDRAKAYPSIVDQLDTLYHGGIDAWKQEIKAVKDQYPKGAM